MKIPFTKYEGLGNDFIVLMQDELSALNAAPAGSVSGWVKSVCDRHTGVGADGVLAVQFEAGVPRMHVINADGTRAAMCGNGLRCVALALHSRGLVEGDAFAVQTDAGRHECRIVGEGDVEVSMAVPSLLPSDLPVLSKEPLVDALMSFDDHEVRLTCVSMGNPHAVIFDLQNREWLGPRIETDARFPDRVNVGFAEVSDHGLSLHVWERGCGWTRACGTGACAAAVAGVETGRLQRGRPISVSLPGGGLEIVVQQVGEPVLMRGPARRVFSGELDLRLFL